MSIFSGESNPISWLKEKTLSSLQTAVSLIDLANEPDTTPWYKRNLLHIAGVLIHRLAPVVAFLNNTGSEAMEPAEWDSILEGGSFALANWCRKWKISDTTQIGKGALLHLRAVDDQAEKDEELTPEPFDGDLDKANGLKLQIYSSMSKRLLHDDLSPAAQKFLLFMLGSLWVSDPPDVVNISKRFLPTDIGISREESALAFEELFERGLVELTEREAAKGTDHLELRLVVNGVNDARHKLPFQQHEFGYDGARIAGKVTMAQETSIALPNTVATTLKRWFTEPDSLKELTDVLQAQIGEDKIYVEGANFNHSSDKSLLIVKYRCPLDADKSSLEERISLLSQTWLSDRIVH